MKGIESGAHRAFSTGKEQVLNAGSVLEFVCRFSRLFDDRSNAVVMYHSVGGPEGSPRNVSVGRLHRDLAYLTETFDVVDLPEVLDAETTTKRVALTFDDGYRNFYTDALPVIRSHDVPATVFVSPGWIDGTEEHRAEATPSRDGPESNPMMVTSQIQQLLDSSLVTVGNHTRTHPDLTAIDDVDRLTHEIEGAKKELERRFDISVDRFAYPHGPFDERCEEIVRDTHELAVTGVPRLVPENADPYRIPRLPADVFELRARWQLTESHEYLERQLTSVGRSIQRFLFE